MLDKIIFFSPLTELTIALYVLGYGLLTSTFFYNKDELKYNLNEISIFGFCIILPIIQVTNFFYPITVIFFYISFSISLFIIFKFKNRIQNFKKWIYKLTIIFIFFIPFKYVIKGNEDLFYHAPKLELLNQFKIIFGIAHFDPSLSITNGWSHISSAFNFLNGSLKNLYLSSYVFFILSILTFYDYLLKVKINIIKIFFSIIITFLLIKFYRLQEFGNDYQAIILLLFSQSLIFKFYLSGEKNVEKKIHLVNKIIFYSFFAIIFRIYSVFVLPTLIILFINKDKIFKFINKKLILVLFLTFLSTSITSLINSGCFFMPIKQTCLSKNIVSWSYINKIDELILHLKTFNTSYRDYKIKDKGNLTKSEWVKDFNWLNYHLKSERFTTPLIKTFLVIFLLFIIITYKKKIKSKILSSKDLLFIFLATTSFLLWLLYTPLFRAGGYAYWSFLILSILLLKLKIEKDLKLQKIKKVLFIIISIVILLNVKRIAHESDKYKTISPFFFTEWAKFHHMKDGYKEELKSILLNDPTNKILSQPSFNRLRLRVNINKINNNWIISEK
jgi:hypothetical protein|tara:strand:- start:2297 stop:3970 length:1674 start_codon:yes stop_codon:yes gene_type:complete